MTTFAASLMGEQSCPQCQSSVPVYHEYVTWCDHCNWNVNPVQQEERAGLHGALGSIYERLGQRGSASLYEKMLRLQTLRPSLTGSKVLAYAIATVVHAVTLLFLGLGIWLIRMGGFMIIWGLLCVAIAWATRPRIASVPKDILPRAQYPALYGLVDRVARTSGAPPVHGIVVDHDFNASFQTVGLQRRRILTLGLPLWAIQGPQERVALLGHELGHSINGDSSRGLFMGSAVNAVFTWHQIILPDRLWPQGTGIEGILMIPFNAFMMLIAGLLWLVCYGLAHLLWRDSQRAEYLADSIAARAGGTEAAVAMMEKMALHKTVTFVVRKLINTRDQTTDLFSAIRQAVSITPERELERVRRAERLTLSRLDVTHPPTSYRIELLRAHAVDAPAVTMSAEEEQQIEAELAPRYQKAAARLLGRA